MFYPFAWALLLASTLNGLPVIMDKIPASTQAPTLPSFWKPISAAQATRLGPPRIPVKPSRVLELNLPALKKTLASAGTAGPVLQLPLPDGSLVAFRMRTTQVMAPELAAKYPELQTYAGQEPGHPAHEVRLEVTPAGLRAMLTRSGHTYFIEPYRRNDTRYYICFDKASLPAGRSAGFEAPD
ncbi:hypothetical protein [Hymenobacter metallicola]|uniref:Uncharacterized protein n=1 Tax=Hymenobacter metallicola TaxID=2563114 RepID=A0A4Z0Q1A3_9BACT|nr:hypothetical protein [Hymenobacter metallicola]TGE23269.1 hypothetical protein E5K02_18900 [Hymenobacter metallicola]